MTVPAPTLAAAGLLIGVVLMWRVRTPGPARPGPRPSVGVVIPARNESTRLPGLLADLSRQTAAPATIVVVDDASSDDTAAVAAAGAAQVVVSGGPPAGWAGKVWACARGVNAAGPLDVLVFLDADVRLADDALARVVDEHRRTAGGLLSVQPYHETERAYEQLSAVANIVPVMASGLAAPRPPRRPALAFGPCLATTPEALQAVGGFASVRGESVEDVALAARFRSAGRPVRCLAGGPTVRFRMYGGGPRALVEGWTKNLAGGARRAPWWSAAGAAVWVTGALAAVAAVLLDPSWSTAVLYGAHVAAFHWMLRRIGRFRWWAWAAYPVPLVAFCVFFAASVVARGVRRRVVWRGRTLQVGG